MLDLPTPPLPTITTFRATSSSSSLIFHKNHSSSPSWWIFQSATNFPMGEWYIWCWVFNFFLDSSPGIYAWRGKKIVRCYFGRCNQTETSARKLAMLQWYDNSHRGQRLDVAFDLRRHFGKIKICFSKHSVGYWWCFLHVGNKTRKWCDAKFKMRNYFCKVKIFLLGIRKIYQKCLVRF